MAPDDLRDLLARMGCGGARNMRVEEKLGGEWTIIAEYEYEFEIPPRRTLWQRVVAWWRKHGEVE